MLGAFFMRLLFLCLRFLCLPFLRLFFMRLLFLSVLIVTFEFSVAAQAFMNIENLRRTDKSGLHGNGSLRVSGALGNTQNFISDTSFSNFYNTKDSEWLLFLNHRYGEAFSKKNADRGKVHLRYTYKMLEQWGLESFLQGQYDDFQRLANRYIYGQALRFKAYAEEASSLYLGFGVFYEWEEVQSLKFGDSQENLQTQNMENLRGNLYASFHWGMKKETRRKNSTVFFTFYYQPSKADDFRLLSTAGYQIPLSSHFSFSIEINGFYDSRPPEGIERADIRYFTTLNYSY